MEYSLDWWHADLRFLLQMMYTIARYYNSSEHMTRFLTKLTNQMIRKCKAQITDAGKLWDQDKPQLIHNMKV